MEWNCGDGRKKGIEKSYVRLHKMGIQAGFLHTEIYNNKEAEDD